MASKSQKLVTGSVLRIIGFILSALVGIILMPFIIRCLGDKMYGLWLLVGTFIGYYSILDLGLSSVVQRFISRALGKCDYKEANKTINTVLFVYSLIGLAIIVLTVLVTIFAPLFSNRIAELRIFQKVILVMGISLAFEFPMRVFMGIIIAHIRYDIMSGIVILQLLLRTLLVIYFLSRGYGIFALVFITVFVNWCGYGLVFIVVKRIYSHLVLSKTLIDISRIKEYSNYSAYTLVSQVADQLKYKIDYLVIASYIGLSFVTLYSVALRLIEYFMEFIASAIGMMLPVFSQYEAKGDYESIREKYIFVTKISSYLTLFVGGILLLCGNSFIRKWMGINYTPAYKIMVIILIPTIFALMQGPVFGLLLGISKHKYYAWINLVEGMCNLVLSILMVKKYGIVGVALGTAIPMIITKVFIQPIYVCKAIGLNITKFYITLMIVIIKGCLIMSLLWLAFNPLIVPDYSKILMYCLFSMVVFFTLIIIVGFGRQEKAYFRSLI